MPGPPGAGQVTTSFVFVLNTNGPKKCAHYKMKGGILISILID